MLIESKMYAGRISREELDYYCSFSNLSLEDILLLNNEEMTKVVFDILGKIRIIFNKIEICYHKTCRYNFCLSEPINGLHGNGNAIDLINIERGTLRKVNTDCRSPYDTDYEKEEYMEIFNLEKKTLLRE